MKWLMSILREILGLFVDDGSFALLLLVWIGLAIFALRYFPVAPQARPVIFCLGLAAILVGSAITYTRRKRR